MALSCNLRGMYQLAQQPTARLGSLPSGVLGTRATLTVMGRLALEGSRDVRVREAAIDALHSYNAASHDRYAQAGALFAFVRDRIMFVGDVLGVETVQSPYFTLRVRAGDCDDRATLLAAMLRSVSIPADFRVIAANPAAPGSFSHVYVVATVAGRRVALDPTYSSNAPGYEFAAITRKGDFSL